VSEIGLERIRACAAEFDMAIPSLMTGGAYVQGLCLSSPTLSVRNKTVTTLISVLEVARRLDAILVVGLLQGLRTDEPDARIANDRIVECLREIGAAAHEQGVQVVLEPVNHLQVGFNNSVGEVLTTIGRVASPAIRPMIDTLHMHIEERAPVRSVLDVGKKIRHVHLCESNGGPFGSGNADLPGILQALKSIDYPYFVSVKIYRGLEWQEAAERAIEYLADLFLPETTTHKQEH